MPSAKLIQKLKPALQNQLPPEQDGILLCLDSDNVTGDNAKYSGLNLNQDKATKPQTVQIVRQGEATLYQFKVNPLYMNMYNRLARWYDFGERWIARLKYGNSINKMRRSLMGELEWRQDCTALYVSIGTGTDLNHLPADIDPSALDLTGADLSLGMLERCRNVWQKKAAGLDLVHCNAEDLPFADNMFDVVFHVGGINFFSDKQKAINEMLRVAKPGTKIMIADETTDFIQQQYKKSLFTRSYFQDTDFDLTQIENCIPETVQEKKTRLLWDNRFYCITFRKPV